MSCKVNDQNKTSVTTNQIANGFKRTKSVNHRPKPSNKVEDHLYKYGGDFRHVGETSSGKRGLNIIKSALQQGGRKTFFLFVVEEISQNRSFVLSFNYVNQFKLFKITFFYYFNKIFFFSKLLFF